MSGWDYLTASGVADCFRRKEACYETDLVQSKPYSIQILENPSIMAIISSHQEDTDLPCFDLAGWIDQAVLEVPAENLTLSDCMVTLDSYQPDQGGDIGVYIRNSSGSELIEITLSIELRKLSVTKYIKS